LYQLIKTSVRYKPSFADLVGKWQVAIRRQGEGTNLWTPKLRSVVCQKHFKEEGKREAILKLLKI
jgi:hypothetical protein